MSLRLEELLTVFLLRPEEGSDDQIQGHSVISFQRGRDDIMCENNESVLCRCRIYLSGGVHNTQFLRWLTDWWLDLTKKIHTACIFPPPNSMPIDILYTELLKTQFSVILSERHSHLRQLQRELADSRCCQRGKSLWRSAKSIGTSRRKRRLTGKVPRAHSASFWQLFRTTCPQPAMYIKRHKHFYLSCRWTLLLL